MNSHDNAIGYSSFYGYDEVVTSVFQYIYTHVKSWVNSREASSDPPVFGLIPLGKGWKVARKNVTGVVEFDRRS